MPLTTSAQPVGTLALDAGSYVFVATVRLFSQGTGSNGHMTGEMFKQRAGINILHVPYRGSAPAVQDLLGGRVQLMFDNLPSVLPLIRSGQLRALAVTTAQRADQLPFHIRKPATPQHEVEA